MKYIYSTIPALVVIGIFLWFSNWIPQTTWEPPKKLQLSADMSPSELVQFGEILVRERGCLTCHTIEEGVGEKGRGRGPNFAGIGALPRTNPKHLAESLYDPGASLVEGYPNIMPSAAGPPARLSYEEATAVVNYLLSLGSKPTVKVGDLSRSPWQGSASSASQAAASSSPSTTTVDIKSIFNKHGCLGCHRLGGEGGNLGPALDRPDLSKEASKANLSVAEYVRQSILSPGDRIAEGFTNTMPSDYGSKMTANELEQVVKHISSAASKAAEVSHPAPQPAAPPLPPGIPVPPPVATPRPSPAATVDVKAILEKQGCLACHGLGGQGGKLGPALDRPELSKEAVRANLSIPEYIRQSIVSPGLFLTQGFPNVMPSDYGNKMTTQELEQVIKYLSGLVTK